MGSRMNAGYLITDSIHIGTTEFVLGVSIAERSMFVTWACQGSDYYYWGHYHSDLLAAKKDLLEGRGSTGVSPKPSRVKRARLLYHSSRALVFYYAILFQHRFSSVFKAETITG